MKILYPLQQNKKVIFTKLKTKGIFDSINFVSGQVEKQCKGVHGLDIPEHKRTFKIFNDPIVNSEKREIMGRLNSKSSYDEIVNYFDKL